MNSSKGSGPKQSNCITGSTFPTIKTRKRQGKLLQVHRDKTKYTRKNKWQTSTHSTISQADSSES